jgi:hypothetical protein
MPISPRNLLAIARAGVVVGGARTRATRIAAPAGQASLTEFRRGRLPFLAVDRRVGPAR